METVIPTNKQDKPIFHTFKVLKNVKSDLEEHVEDHESIGQLANDPRWQAMQRVIEERMNALDALEGMIEPNDTVESVGFRYLATRVALSHLRDMLNLPNAIQEATALQEGGGKTGKK